MNRLRVVLAVFAALTAGALTAPAQEAPLGDLVRPSQERKKATRIITNEDLPTRSGGVSTVGQPPAEPAPPAEEKAAAGEEKQEAKQEESPEVQEARQRTVDLAAIEENTRANMLQLQELIESDDITEAQREQYRNMLRSIEESLREMALDREDAETHLQELQAPPPPEAPAEQPPQR